MLSCCVTGHRHVPKDVEDIIQTMLTKEIREAIEAGYQRFYSGMADGVDLMFVRILAELRDTDFPDIIIEGAIPHRSRLGARCKEFQRLIKFCDFVHVVSESSHAGAYHKRNRFMVENSQRVIAVYDGRGSGGTFYTINYAKPLKKELRIISMQ